MNGRLGNLENPLARPALRRADAAASWRKAPLSSLPCYGELRTADIVGSICIVGDASPVLRSASDGGQ